MTVTVSCRKISKTYGEGTLAVHAVRDLDLTIDEGEFVSVSGPSGSGKTTLLNLIGGLDRLTSGEIEVDGHRIDTMSAAELADLRLHEIGFVFQAYNLIPVLSAYENVEFIMQLQGVSRDERHHRAREILHEVGLDGLGDRRPAELSGGQQQRVAVARAGRRAHGESRLGHGTGAIEHHAKLECRPSDHFHRGHARSASHRVHAAQDSDARWPNPRRRRRLTCRAGS